MRCNAENGNKVYDRPKQFKKYCNQYLNVDNKTINRQFSSLKRKGIEKYRFGHRFSIPSLKHFLLNRWNISLVIVPYEEIKRRNEDTDEIEIVLAYNYRHITAISLLKGSKERKKTIRELLAFENISVETLGVLLRMSRQGLYKIIRR